MSAALSFEHVSKHYRGAREYRALRDDAVRVLGAAIGVRRPPRHTVRALDDVSFEIEQGESVALMGPNGSGKTTALKILSRVTYPTAGRVGVRGRVGALLEVGTGLHPELTGRENVLLYGRILGLHRREIRRKFDDIVAFAEVGPAIDQPVKQYSSGMQLRLGFAVASHLEPEILLVDEAISVGDAGFQFRCLERMRELVKTGVTLVFVSHVPPLAAELCRSGILLSRGRAVTIGAVSDVIKGYLALATEVPDDAAADGAEPREIRLVSWDWELQPSNGRFLGDLSVNLKLEIAGALSNPKFGVAIASGPGNIVNCSMLADGFETGPLGGTIGLGCVMRDLPLEPGPYEIWASAMGADGMSYLLEPRCVGYVMLESGPRSTSALFAGTAGHGVVRVPYEWTVSSQGDVTA
jgi:ABC-type polysaccharide/polyol phosphate transport system ATPase subunit